MINWTGPNINHSWGKISKNVGILNIVKSLLVDESLVLLYCSTIHPFIQCPAMPQWPSQSFCCTAKKKFVIFSTDYLPLTDPIFKALNILKLSNLHTYHCSMFVFKYSSHKHSWILSSFSIESPWLWYLPGCRTQLHQSSIHFPMP